VAHELLSEDDEASCNKMLMSQPPGQVHGSLRLRCYVCGDVNCWEAEGTNALFWVPSGATFGDLKREYRAEVDETEQDGGVVTVHFGGCPAGIFI